MKILVQLLFILLFSTLLASCGSQNTPAAQVILSPSPQPSATTIPTPVPTDVFFLESDLPGADQMLALLTGRLILVDDCPRAEVSDGSSVLLLWPYNYSIDRSTNPAQIRDDTGQVVARIGDYIEMAGGNVPDSSDDKLPNRCAGPLWIVGGEIRALDASFPLEAGVGGFSMTDSLEGKLVLVNGCLRVQDSQNKRFLLIWPIGPYHTQEHSSQVYDAMGYLQARVGEKIKVWGGEVPSFQVPPGDITKPMLVQPLPKACAAGPYWNVEYIEQ